MREAMLPDLQQFLGFWSHRRRYRRFAAESVRSQTDLVELSDSDLRRRSAAVRHRARTGANPGELIVPGFALMREACRRTLGMQHYDVQLQAGAALCERRIIEMQTGEGKTLTAALPLYIYSLYGRGAYLATSNDYLARRDAEWLTPALALLGTTVGFVTAESEPADRRQAYRCDVTYGTGKEFGFDFLRDRLQAAARGDSAKLDENHSLQRKPFFVLVDEADNVLIDDAGTPLIIAAAPRPVSATTAARFSAAARHASQFEEQVHFAFDQHRKRVELTSVGRALVRNLPLPAETRCVGWPTLYEDFERAVLARRNYLPERQYLVRDGEIVIVDEFTGRIAEGRKWRDGLHQAIEAQEGLPITDDGGQAARITVQEFFRRFPNLAGMTGTAANSAREFRAVYGLPTFIVPTHRPSRRTKLPPQIFSTAEAKWNAIVAEVVAMHRAGRPVLIGTRSIDKSRGLSQQLALAGLQHSVLNALEIAREAEIVAKAGTAGAVTVATNMAGRGTDISLGPGVGDLGGLHVILTEMHEASRIDRQFIGRGARQGDAGSYRIYLSLEDDLPVEIYGLPSAPVPQDSAANEIPIRRLPQFIKAQRRVERQSYLRRRLLILAERNRNQIAESLGIDPYLDLPG